MTFTFSEKNSMQSHQTTKINSNRQKSVNNGDNTGDSSQVTDKNEGQNILDKVKKKESLASKPNNLEDVKSHEEFREETKRQREKQPKHAKPKRISSKLSSLSIKNRISGLNDPSSDISKSKPDYEALTTMIPNTEMINTTKADNTTALFKSPEASIVSSSNKRDEDIQTKHVGFRKQSYRQFKLSTQPNHIEPTHQSEINYESVHKVSSHSHKTTNDHAPVQPVLPSKMHHGSYHTEPTHQSEINYESVHKVSSHSHKTTNDHAPVQPVLPSKMHHGSHHTEPTELKQVNEFDYRSSIRSQKATYTPSLMNLVAPKEPGEAQEPLAPEQSRSTLVLPSVAGVSTTFKTYEVPVTADKAPKPTTSKPRPGETAFTEGLSEQTLYVRVTKKLPSNGPLSINDLDDFLKKSKKDFEHFYYKKPISSMQITDFDLIKTLGVGAFGKVVLAEWKQDKTLYAVKIIDKVGVVKRNHVRYVSNEKRILQALNFPFVINLKYFFTDFYYLYFVMPYIAGGNFYRHLKICRKIKESEAKFYIGQLVLALEYLHYLELIHRDVKTENVMIDAFGYLKLVDFGQCIRCYSNDKTWTFTGTPDYMAPEIIVGKGYDCAVDWWALGIITFELCAGFRPFKEASPQKLQLLILCNQYSIPSSFSRSLKKLIESLLVLEPKKRIANYTRKASIIKKHVWFKELDWLALLNRTLEAPYLPNAHKSSQINPSQQKDQEK